MECSWLPPLQMFSGNLEEYNELLYQIFVVNYMNNHPMFNGKVVVPRKHPIYNGKYESFFHITCGHYLNIEDRVPDFRRCERIEWPKAMIEYNGCHCIENCENFLIWKKKYKNTYRYSFLLKNERYLVIIEERKKYYILITASPLTYSHALSDQLVYYEEALKTENAIR